MRIIAGTYKSRKLKMVPTKDTRETSDKVRGAVFNMIGSKVLNSVVLDLFAGSGSYGLEAISRGSKKVVFNDFKLIAYKTLLENISSLGVLAQSIILKLDYVEALKKLKNEAFKFDIVFIDPPYQLGVYTNVLTTLEDVLNKEATVVLEMDKNNFIEIDDFKNYEISKEKIYGTKKIIILNHFK